MQIQLKRQNLSRIGRSKELSDEKIDTDEGKRERLKKKNKN